MRKDLFLEAVLRQMRILAVYKHIPHNGAICDIGCGLKGALLSRLKKKISRGVGIDKKVNPYKDDKIELINDNMNKTLPLEDENFDCVTLIAVIEHLDFPEEILEETYRILKPDGKLILTTPAPCSKPVLDFLAFKLGVISAEEIAEHKYYFSESVLKELLEKIGYKNIKISNFEHRFNILVLANK